MTRKIVGDPLTGSLPRTRLVIPQPILGPTPKPTALTWPHIPDVEAVTTLAMIPGRIAVVRTRRGIRRYQIRNTRISTEPGRNRGRHYFTGHNRQGICRTYWIDSVIRVESIQLALSRRPAQPALPPVTT